MRRVVWLSLMLLALVACGGRPPPGPDPLPPLDQAGNRYPDACMTDLTPLLADDTITVERWSQARIQRAGDAAHIFGRNRRGIAMLRRLDDLEGKPRHVVVIATELEDWQYRDSLRHELCHIVAGPYWHPIPE